jgi:hypothetical protein
VDPFVDQQSQLHVMGIKEVRERTTLLATRQYIDKSDTILSKLIMIIVFYIEFKFDLDKINKVW